MSSIPRVLAAICIGGLIASPVVHLRDGVASPRRTNIIRVAYDVPSEAEVRAAILQQEKREGDEDLAVLKNKLNKDVSQCRSFSIDHCIYTTKTMFGQPLNNPGWYYYAPFPPNARPFDSQSSCARAAVEHCNPGYTGNDGAAAELQKDRDDIANFKYTEDNWVLYIRSIDNYEGTIVAHVTYRKKHTESNTFSKKISMERRSGILVILTIDDE